MVNGTLLRRVGADDLGLRQALSDRLLPWLVAAMAFLAALALAGAVAASGLARHWQQGAAAILTVQVPSPDAPSGPVAPDDAATRSAAGGTNAASPGDSAAPNAPAQPAAGPAPGYATAGTGAAPASGVSRANAVLAALRDQPGVREARMLSGSELSDLLRPWLGADAGALSFSLPAVIETRLGNQPPDLAALSARLQAVAPGTLVERNEAWMERLSALARSLQACVAAALIVVAGVAAAVVAVATRAGLYARREAIEIVHGLGATDGYIAGRFARRVTLLALSGAVLGTLAALPVLLGLATLAAPFSGGLPAEGAAGAQPALSSLAALPPSLWFALPGPALVAALIGWLTAQGTVRAWLRRLP
jgi:cell division transport system permease protein